MRTSSITQKAQAQLGIKKLRKHQIKPIQSILDGYDTMVIAPTSAGKSAIYQLPALVMAEQGKWTLVIEPTLSLISDQVQKLQDKGINAAYVTSRNKDKDKEEHCAIYRRLNLNTISILEPFPQKRTQNKRKKPNKNAEIKCTAIRRRKRQVQLQNLQAKANQGQNGDGWCCKRLRDRQRHRPAQLPL